jgi:pantoate--beta-alanine ligase
MTKLIKSVAEWMPIRQGIESGQSIGFVPTMGALHRGHQCLVKRSIQENAITVVSIFVNPTQFNDQGDFNRYPRSDEQDFALLQALGVDYIFFPEYADLYPDDFHYKISEHAQSRILEGVSRPGHFDGVLTVVMKLINIIRASRCYFGEKDFQQYQLIDGMCKAFFVPTEIIVCPTVRDADGLALSSRNRLLSAAEREKAALFPAWLKSGKKNEEVIQALEREGFKVDYVETIDSRRYGAVYLGQVRLIDNVSLDQL